jgi:glucose-1-phosphate thymidylyltransferase
MDDKIIGEKLKNIREKMGMTQSDVAIKLDIGRDAVVRIEKGTRKISVEEFKKITEIYNIDARDILENKKVTDSNLKGIILAGGSGTRLYPITMGTSKQLLPVYDKPMIYYPLSVLMQAGINDIMIITTKEDQENFKRLLKDGKKLGINITYEVQEKPEGLAQALLIGEKFIGDNACAMVLGDNIFYGSGLARELKEASVNAINNYATIFGYQVKDPERFGIMELDENNNVLSVEEKPLKPKSDYAITGLYFYPKGVSKKAKTIKKSARGEYEITTLNDTYLQEKHLKARLLNDGYSWFDTGTFNSMLDASNMIRTIETNREMLICSPEKIAYENGWINDSELEEICEQYKKNSYGEYLKKVLKKRG